MIEPVVAESVWSPSMVTALFTGIVALLGAVTAMIVSLVSLRRESAKAAEKMTVQVDEVHSLVNAGNSALLEKIARLSRRIAIVTGDEGDGIEANAAEHDANMKAKVTESALLRREAADAKK